MNGVVHVPFVDLSAQYRAIQETVDEAMADVLHRTAFILGQEVELFEHEFATFCGTRYAAGVDSGLSALELILRAYEIGLVNRVFPPEQLLDEAKKFATKLAGMPSHALKMAKTAANGGYDLTLDSGLVLETQCFAHCWSHPDLEEGTGAFVEKRKASFHDD